MLTSLMILGIWDQFLQIALTLKYPSDIKTELSDDLRIRVRPHLMLNKEPKSLDYFSCVPVHDLGYLGPVSPKCPNTRVPGKHV